MGAASALTFTALHPDLVDGVVALNGTANHLEYKNFQDAITASFGGNKVEKPLEYRKRSAEFHPNKFRMPIAATTGGKDTSVPPESIFRLVKAIGEHNRHVLHIHRPTGGHQTTYEDTRQALRFVVEALKKHHEAEPAGE